MTSSSDSPLARMVFAKSLSLPAGVAGMPFWRFSLYTLLGCVPWVFFLGCLGREARERGESIRGYLHLAD